MGYYIGYYQLKNKK